MRSSGEHLTGRVHEGQGRTMPSQEVWSHGLAWRSEGINGPPPSRMCLHLGLVRHGSPAGGRLSCEVTGRLRRCLGVYRARGERRWGVGGEHSADTPLHSAPSAARRCRMYRTVVCVRVCSCVWMHVSAFSHLRTTCVIYRWQALPSKSKHVFFHCCGTQQCVTRAKLAPDLAQPHKPQA